MRKPRVSDEVFVRRMLQRFADAGERGIDRQFVPGWILTDLQNRGHVTKIEAAPRITEAGLRALGGHDA